MITLRDVTIGIAGRTLVSEVSASVAAGEFVAILGPNGVGKTTLLRIIAALHRQECGEVTVDATDLHTLTPIERARRIAYVLSDDTFTEGLRVRDIVEIGRYPHHRWWQWNPRPDDYAEVHDALVAVHMEPYAERLFSTLSSGERQRVWIAMGIAQSTPALILDEPTSHLDVRVAHEILGLLRTLAGTGKTVVCVLHDLNDAAAYCDRLMLLGCERMLAYGTPEEVLQPQLLEEAYGIAMERLESARGIRVFATPQ